MTLCKINKLEIQGFRAFGRTAQTLEFPSLLASVWGPNSQGKTSLAEAVEFLLTGEIVRRALMASGQDEFADSLRNAHLPAGMDVFVQATVLGIDGKEYVVRRTLTTDYGKKQECVTALTIDGTPCNETGLAALGIRLSQPPLRAPVLAQHTLGYVFSAKPQDRSSYFKALLEVTDLDEFRSQVAALEKEIAPPENPLLAKFAAAVAVPAAAQHLKPFVVKVLAANELAASLSNALKAIIEASGETAPAGYGERKERVVALLAEKQAKTFPLKGFDRKPLAAWAAPAPERIASLHRFVEERGKIDAEVRRLANLFREALALPAVHEAAHPIDCPLCGAEDTLTPERIALLRERVADTEAFQKALKDAREALGPMTTGLSGFETALRDALPIFITNPSKFRRARGFRVERICELLGADGQADIEAWLSSLRILARDRSRVIAAIRGTGLLVESCAKNMDGFDECAKIEDGFGAVAEAHAGFASALAAYGAAEDKVRAGLQAIVDAQSETAGWQELIELADNPAALRSVMIERTAYAEAAKELAQAIKQIDKGNEAVLDEKFGDLSDGVQKWWDILRPEEHSYFDGVKQRPGARRTIDFKAGLSIAPDRSSPQLRDVVAVFSMSQLHCLGLALFLARAVNEKVGFVVLDDPILSSDEDYRAFFNAMVVEELINLGMQVIVLTQDQKTWKDLGERYLHQGIGLFQIDLRSPADGSAVANTADDLETKFMKAEILVRGGHPSLHKQGGELIRDAAERFCKEMLIKERRAKGEAAASLNDYGLKNLGHLAPLVEPLLTRDPSHAGKLRAIGGAVNPAKHDDAIPAAGVLKVALGDIRFLKKTYL
ncbi:AAA family ATPase [Mesorhizobium sp. BR1-1-13]|uniref:AAA family ATPase n=1 Tax=Mesorhizobium sp. BR1-1-13 TaxID=2876656 RepID=UPI001CD07F2A|nr:ATP-binding protein [Mesorhizobium sp. BR1-1-13]MBZ9944498.1 AAA family ATPase [Mesorhizobium sp. BR1-1-13]